MPCWGCIRRMAGAAVLPGWYDAYLLPGKINRLPISRNTVFLTVPASSPSPPPPRQLGAAADNKQSSILYISRGEQCTVVTHNADMPSQEYGKLGKTGDISQNCYSLTNFGKPILLFQLLCLYKRKIKFTGFLSPRELVYWILDTFWQASNSSILQTDYKHTWWYGIDTHGVRDGIISRKDSLVFLFQKMSMISNIFHLFKKTTFRVYFLTSPTN